MICLFLWIKMFNSSEQPKVHLNNKKYVVPDIDDNVILNIFILFKQNYCWNILNFLTT